MRRVGVMTIGSAAPDDGARAELIQQLRGSQRRDAAADLLAGRSRKDLAAIATEAKVRVDSRANKEDLVDRIVEGTCGFRLRHEAIRWGSS
jgi:hypothetical protein